ncbi:excinuclease ABC subunit UvrA [Azohydromonas lata]|uniref:UvrABC system protein A n=1 Tax=Azohydromonas lata TaxID=45677 RepID=A0ABU5INY0_9BURK|nr:excinuclease ABC subunit UvrA [Azohydromonas lata]MDZ5460600.1 excinuclease ABC subunit UvrA [Azohydromonas lata]
MNGPGRDVSARSGGCVQVRGARERNLKNVDVDIPRDVIVAFTGVSGSGKSSLAFGTLFAEAQRRYLDSVTPFARRLIEQVGAPEVDLITGLPPAVALEQRRGPPSARSTVATLTHVGDTLRLLYSRCGARAPGSPALEASGFSAHTPEGACPACHGLGVAYEVSEHTLVPDETLTIRQRAIAAWPPAWHGQNLREILVSIGIDVDVPWRDLPEAQRRWVLFTDEQPTVPVYPGLSPVEMRQAISERRPGSYQGTFSSARHYLLQTFATTHSASIRRRVARYLVRARCTACGGCGLRPEALAVTVRGMDIASVMALAIRDAKCHLESVREGADPALRRLLEDLLPRLNTLCDLGLGYLPLDRPADTLSPGEHQRVRLATLLRSNLFGVVYVLDEPSAGLHPADTEPLLDALDHLRDGGNSVFVVEHDLDVVRRADWVVDIGPDAGEGGGQVLYSGPVEGLAAVSTSRTGRHLAARTPTVSHAPRAPRGWLELSDVHCHNLHGVDVRFPLSVFTCVTGVSGSGKTSLVGRALVELVGSLLDPPEADDDEVAELDDVLPHVAAASCTGRVVGELHGVVRLVAIDQKPIGRTPRSNLATYTGLFDSVRALFAATPLARALGYRAGRFSFNVASGRCPKCEGAGHVVVELMFLPSAEVVCPACRGRRYADDTLQVTWQGRNVADVLALSVDEAAKLFEGHLSIVAPLQALRRLGLGYLRLGQPATQLSGGEAQRIKLATELQRAPRGHTLYVLDEPTIGLHPSDVERLTSALHGLVDSGHTVVVIEHDMRVVSQSDWVIDLGPGAGDAGGTVVASGTPLALSRSKASRTAPYLRQVLTGSG